MHNYKKLIAIPLAAVALFASCNKTLNAESAKKFVDTAYSGKTIKELNELEVIASIKNSFDDSEVKDAANEMMQEIAKDYGLTYTVDTFAIRGNATKESKGFMKFNGDKFSHSIINSSDIQTYEELKDTKGVKINVAYTSNSNELSVYCDGQAKQTLETATASESVTELDIYNSNGQLRYIKQVQTIKVTTKDNKENTFSMTATFACTF